MSKRGLHLYKRLALTMLTALIGLGGTAQADIHAAGPVYGGPMSAGGLIACRVFNFGNVPVTITSIQIFADTSAQIPTTGSGAGDSCLVATPLTTGQTCLFFATITGSNTAYSCRIIDNSTSSSLSGSAEIQSPTGGVLGVLPLLH